MAAAMKGNTDCLDVLMDMDFDTDPNLRDASGRWVMLCNLALTRLRTALMMVAEQGNLDAVRVLLHSSETDARLHDNNHRTAVHFAARNGHSEVVEELVSTRRATLACR